MSGEVSDKTAFPRASRRVRVMEAVGRDEWEALERAILAEIKLLAWLSQYLLSKLLNPASLGGLYWDEFAHPDTK